MLTVSSWLKEYTPWPYLEQAFKLERKVYTLEGKLVSEEVRYGITSLAREVAKAERLLAIVRAGGDIENTLHHQRDVQLAEDYCRFRPGNSNEVNAILNNTVSRFAQL